ncbi:MAG: zinc ribbon domain-containing protein [Candidatus Lokiarchaeota archaeon]|nr:zinc ribbon domain-containing protein [Candidatus Lokiarchaeota archaeon]
MMVDNDFTQLALRMKVFAILSMVSLTLGLVEAYLLPVDLGISGFVSIPLLVFQVLIIVGAKKCATAYKNERLNTFGTLMIVSFVASIASVGLIFIMTFFEVLREVMSGGSGTINILPMTLAMEIISIATLAFETVAWCFMLSFFDNLEELDARARGKPGAILALVGSCVAIASSVAIGIPTIINNPTIDLNNIALVMPIGQIVASELLSIANLVTTVVGYLIMSQTFQLLGNLRPRRPRFPAPSTAASFTGPDPYYQPPGAWDGDVQPVDPYGSRSPPPGAWNGDERPIDRETAAPGGPGPRTCPFCGAPLYTSDPRATFCGECGRKVPGGDQPTP